MPPNSKDYIFKFSLKITNLCIFVKGLFVFYSSCSFLLSLILLGFAYMADKNLGKGTKNF
jgi:hypothetical protein